MLLPAFEAVACRAPVVPAGTGNSSLSALVTFCLPLLITSVRVVIVAGTANFVFVADP